ncbi:NAD(P)H-dependent oxidoreductase [Kibdelosporangium philippinense]|uniref:NAD(P)H-dependent oxidoreductase n=1 Tax=Kibdelosporangium philippinense TaxID=211113 RepID=A0ABS8Z5E8_9PSEU|nr:NAD(P)H-dependent oxidoreductase [Kibdelosporangium philippinense]MCE7002263.1 NAD(P)H-dependent oxidoreductase [Kibdelosporangium philippinense]
MTDPSALNVLAICGSLRAGSFNAGLVRALTADAPPAMKIDVLDAWHELPPLNNDLVVGGVLPGPVQHISDRIRAADAVIIATPEYCYGVPGTLKNLLDWMSFPPPVNCFRFKPVGVLGASAGAFGTVRAQLALRQTLMFLDATVMTKPEVYVTDAASKYDSGVLADQPTIKLLRHFLDSFEEFVRVCQARGLDPATREFLFT